MSGQKIFVGRYVREPEDPHPWLDWDESKPRALLVAFLIQTTIVAPILPLFLLAPIATRLRIFLFIVLYSGTLLLAIASVGHLIPTRYLGMATSLGMAISLSSPVILIDIWIVPLLWQVMQDSSIMAVFGAVAILLIAGLHLPVPILIGYWMSGFRNPKAYRYHPPLHRGEAHRIGLRGFAQIYIHHQLLRKQGGEEVPVASLQRNRRGPVPMDLQLTDIDEIRLLLMTVEPIMALGSCDEVGAVFIRNTYRPAAEE